MELTNINKQFKIKVYGKGINKLVGVRGLREIVNNDDLIKTMTNKALKRGQDKFEQKLRRGIKITLYSY